MKVIDINRDEGNSKKRAHEKSLHTLKRTGGGAALRMQVAAVSLSRNCDTSTSPLAPTLPVRLPS